MLFITKRYKTLAGLAAGGIGLATLTTCFEGLDIWPGYLHTLFSFGALAANRSAHGVIKSVSYMDLVSFFSILPGGNSPLGRALLWAGIALAGVILIRVWWKSAAAPKETQFLIWAATLTWTLVLNVYVPIYDTILVVLSVIVTAGVVRQLPGKRVRQFTPICLLLIVCSWLTVPVAQHTGIQMMTILLVTLGLLQLAAARRVQVSASGYQPHFRSIECRIDADSVSAHPVNVG
jgi:hypothetical protein